MLIKELKYGLIENLKSNEKRVIFLNKNYTEISQIEQVLNIINSCMPWGINYC